MSYVTGTAGTCGQTLVSIIVPTHNEASNIAELYRRIVEALAPHPQYAFELIFSDDSTDETPQLIAEMGRHDARVKLIRLSRSFGQAVAIAAGLERAGGAAAIMMDADLQDPPEAIPQLLAEWRKGNKLVYVERKSSSSSLLYFVFAQIFYRTLKMISDTPIPMDAGEFRLMDRQLIDFMKGLREHSRFIRGLSVWPGFPASKIRIVRAARASGQTNYNFRRSLFVAIDGFISFSIKPLRMAVVLGIVMSMLSVLGILYAVILRLFTPYWSPGWTLLFSAMLLISGMQFIFIGILGEYIGRIFTEVQGRPLYIVDYTLGFGPEHDEAAKTAFAQAPLTQLSAHE